MLLGDRGTQKVVADEAAAAEGADDAAAGVAVAFPDLADAARAHLHAEHRAAVAAAEETVLPCGRHLGVWELEGMKDLERLLSLYPSGPAVNNRLRPKKSWPPQRQYHVVALLQSSSV